MTEAEEQDYWMAEWLRGFAAKDKLRMENAGLHLRIGEAGGGLLIPAPLAEVIRLTKVIRALPWWWRLWHWFRRVVGLRVVGWDWGIR